MNVRFPIAFLLPLVCLAGCTTSTTPVTQTTTSSSNTGNWGNWQIQAGSAITSPPNTYPSFLGAIQVQGTQATGIFTTVVSASTTGQPLDYSGFLNSSTEDVTLATFGYEFGYTQPTTPYTLVPVGIIGGCVYPPTYTGPECLAITAGSAVGVEVAPINGTYTGTLTDSATPSMSGTASLTLTQSTTANTSGQFPLTGTITFPSSSGLGTASLGGTVSGIGLTLGFYSTAVVGPNISLTAYTNPTASQITITNLGFSSGIASENAAYTGTLTLQ
jgi:hypothetical protein